MISLATAAQLTELAMSITAGTITVAEAARKLIGIGLDLVPVEDLKAFLTDEARKRADLAADLAEDVKFGAE